jgi:hypothetical protein
MGWEFTPETYDAVDINDGVKYQSAFQFPDDPMALVTRQPVEIAIPGDYSFPESPRSQVQSGRLILHVDLLNISQDVMNEARRLFDRYKGLVTLQTKDDFGGTWNVSVKCERFIQEGPNRFTVVLYAPRPVLESAQLSDNSGTPRTFSATPSTWQLSPVVNGTVRTYPLFEVKGTVAKSNANDYIRGMHKIIAWRSKDAGEDSVGGLYPIDIADGSFDTAAEVAASRMQADGDDLRVLVDGVEVPRTLDGMNTPTTKVWCGISFDPGLKATLLAAMASGASPANGGEIEVSDELGLLGWPERGYFLIDNECLWYGERTTTKLKKLKRGQRDTTAAAHSAAARIDWVEHDIQMIWNYTAAASPPIAVPGINVISSTNLAHTYSSKFASPLSRQPGQMKRRFTNDNVMSALLSYRETTAGAIIGDVPPGGALAGPIQLYPYNNVELYVPCGVKAAAGAIAFDVIGGVAGGAAAAGADIALNGRLYGVDIDTGVEKLLATYKKADRGAGKTLTPDAVLQRLRFNAVYNVITGAFSSVTPSDVALANNLTDEDLQRFTLDQAVQIVSLALFARENAGADTKTLDVRVQSGSGNPESSLSIPILEAAIPNSQLATTYGFVYRDAPAGGSLLPAAVYDLIFHASAAGAGTLFAAYYPAIYPKGNRWNETASAWAEDPQFDHAVLIIGDGSIVQPESPTGMGGFVAWDTITVTFDDTNLRTPRIVSGAARAIYIHRGVISNDDTGQSITLFYVAALSELITVDCYRKEVILDDTLGIFAPGAAALSDPEQWLHLRGDALAASNDLRYVETGIGTVTILTKWKDNWA